MAGSNSLQQLYLSRLRDFYRQPARIFWVYGFPTVLAVCLGLAFKNQAVEVVAVDLVSNAYSAPFEKALADYNTRATKEKTGRLILNVGPEEAAVKRLMTGKTPLVIDPQPDKTLKYRFDPTRPEAATARSAIDNILQISNGRTNPVATTDDKIDTPGSRYIDFLIPGLIGVNTMGGGLWGIGFLIVNFRIAKLLKCFVATPMPRRNFLLALLGARLTFLIPDLAILLSLGYFGFQMPIRGSLFLVIVLDILGALSFAGLGLLVGSRAQSTETVSGLMNLVMLPMWIFSGVFFSADRFPDVIQPVIQLLPLTQLINGLRAVILEGAGWTDVIPCMIVLIAWSVITFVLALKVFRWT